MQTEFPQSSSKYLKAKDFQDNPMFLTFQGWDKKGNVDDKEGERKNPKTWKEKLDYILQYSYPEWATDRFGEKLLDNEGNPFKNKFWDENHPHGYTIVYYFDEGELDSGSKPLFEAFCKIRPGVGEKLRILRTGEGKDTEWSVKRLANDLPEVQISDLSHDPLEKKSQEGNEEVVPF